MRSYDIEGREGDADSPAPDTQRRDTAPTDTVSETGEDVRGEDLQGDTRDVSEGSDGDAADTDPFAQCPAKRPRYTIRRARQLPPSIDADCTEAEFGHAESLPIPDPDEEADSENSSDNVVDCRMVWSEQTNQVHACCDVEDETLVYSTDPDDPVQAIYGGTENSSGDDRMEFARVASTEPTDSDIFYKIFVNVESPFPVHYTVQSVVGENNKMTIEDDGFEGNVRETSDGYVAEWRTDIGFPREPGRVGLCNFLIVDIDPNEDKQRALAFGTGYAINKPERWGCCLYE